LSLSFSKSSDPKRLVLLQEAATIKQTASPKKAILMFFIKSNYLINFRFQRFQISKISKISNFRI
jgi:hypothetical protein